MFEIMKATRNVVAACAALSLACRHEPATESAAPQVVPETARPPAQGASPGEQRFPPGPTRPVPTIQLEPIDLTTSVGETPLQVLVSNLGAPVGATVLNQIAGAVTLRTWPEQALVPFTVAKIVDATGAPDQDEFAHIYLAPSAPLADRWYALSVDALPTGTGWPAFASVLDLKSGARVSRFRVGSEPIVAGVRVYAKDPTRQIIEVDFSERITGDPRLIGASFSGGGSPGCQPDATSPPPHPASSSSGAKPPPGAPASASTASVRLICASIDLQKPLQFDIRPGLRSTSGPQVNAGSAVRQVVNPTDWIDWGDGGKLFRPATP